MNKEEILFQIEQEDSWLGKRKRTVVYRKNQYVLSALKYTKIKGIDQRLQIDYSVGYLIDCGGFITRDLANAFVFELNSIVEVDEYLDKPEYNRSHDTHETKPRMEFYKNGLFIQAILLDSAQKWLDDHPLPRKSISKMTRQNVYSKYNGRCAYCGCEIDLNEMQVDHLVAHMSRGGEDTLDNYYPSCSVCNRVKSNKTLDGFKNSIRHCGEIHRKRKKPIMADSDKIAIKYELTEKDHPITFFFENYKQPKIDIKKIGELL